MLNARKTKVQTLPVSSCVSSLDSEPFLRRAGKISRTTTAEVAFASDDVIAMVWAKRPASTSPTSPWGKSLPTNKAYDCEGSERCGSSSGAAHIGKNNTSGHAK